MARTDLEELLPHTEWGIFLSRLPVRAYREGMTEQDARAWLDDWEAGGGWRESFVLARRDIGAWSLVDESVNPMTPMPTLRPGVILQLVKAQRDLDRMGRRAGTPR